MGQVLVLVERSASDGSVRRATCSLLTIARRLGTPVAVLCGPGDKRAMEVLGRFGAETVFRVEGLGPAAAPATARADVLVELAGRLEPAAILITSGYAGQEIAARVAVRLDAGIIADAIDVRAGADGPTADQTCLAGSYLVESEVVRGTPVITVRPEAARPEPAPVDPVVESIAMASCARTPPIRLRSSRLRTPDRRPSLETADVVVAGGRGLGSPDAFGVLDRVAEALGGAVGGSHTATELGWCPKDRRIGSTGRVVHPRLYVATGISGSVRHRAGMQGSKTIVAITDDPAAPIFRIADFGVVGDVHRVLPALLAEIAKRRGQGYGQGCGQGSAGDSVGKRDLAEA